MQYHFKRAINAKKFSKARQANSKLQSRKIKGQSSPKLTFSSCDDYDDDGGDGDVDHCSLFLFSFSFVAFWNAMYTANKGFSHQPMCNIIQSIMFTLRLRPHVNGYFWKCKLFYPSSKKSVSTRYAFWEISLSTRKRKNQRKHSHDHCCFLCVYQIKRVISSVWRHRFRKVAFPPSTRKRETGVFKNFLSGERLRKNPFSIAENAGYVSTEGRNVKINLRFQKYPYSYVWMGP